jgi:uncharacterized protein (DUF58 family)
MTYPTRRAALLLGAGFGAALLPALFGAPLWRVWMLVLAGSLLAILADLGLAMRAARLRIDVSLPKALFVGDRDEMTLVVNTGWNRPVEMELLAELDEILAPPTSHRQVVRGAATIGVPLVPVRRGAARVEAVWVRWTGPLSLVSRSHREAIGQTVPVVPNTRAVQKAALRYFGARTAAAGLKIERYLGDGSEFDSLREYVPGLDPRNTDWKASARRRRILLRDYRADRNHPVVLALDTGYLMSERLAGIPRLDHAINAALMLAYVALKTGDRVGLLSFDDRVGLFVEPRGGVRTFATLQKHTADLTYSHAETNFTLALTDLARRLRRRSLVIALTDFVDTVTAGLMVENLDRLARRHLVVFVTLRDPLPHERAGRAPRSMPALHGAVAAAELVREREAVVSRLKRLGVECLESPVDDLSPRLVQRYLEIRRQERIG